RNLPGLVIKILPLHGSFTAERFQAGLFKDRLAFLDLPAVMYFGAQLNPGHQEQGQGGQQEQGRSNAPKHRGRPGSAHGTSCDCLKCLPLPPTAVVIGAFIVFIVPVPAPAPSVGGVDCFEDDTDERAERCRDRKVEGGRVAEDQLGLAHYFSSPRPWWLPPAR